MRRLHAAPALRRAWRAGRRSGRLVTSTCGGEDRHGRCAVLAAEDVRAALRRGKISPYAAAHDM